MKYGMSLLSSTYCYNLEVTLSHFWQFVTHWKYEHKANLNISCEAGKLHLEFSANLDHPDLQHFTMPTTKNLSPSKLRRKERRKDTKETNTSKIDVNINVKHEEYIISSENISNMCSSDNSLPHSMPPSFSTPLCHPMLPSSSISPNTLPPLSSPSPYLFPTYIPNVLSNQDPEPNHTCEQCNFNHFPHPCLFSQNNKVQMYQCAKCHKNSNTENELKKHLERTHYYCKQCGTFYEDIFALKNHTNVITNCSPNPYRKA